MSEGEKTPSRYVVITESSSGTADVGAPHEPGNGVADPAGHSQSRDPEAVRRVEVADEDRMAFRVGVNLLVLLIIGGGGYLLWRHFFG